MKSYKEFKKIYIGGSDLAALTLRSGKKIANLSFVEDGEYSAYECFGDDVEIGAHYTKVFNGDYWLAIYDDYGRTYKSYCPEDYCRVDVYRAGDFGCIIHWHN